MIKKTDLWVKCVLCGCEKKYKSKNPYPCPARKTHKWYLKERIDNTKKEV